MEHSPQQRSSPSMPPAKYRIEQTNAYHSDSEMPLGMAGHLENAVIVPVAMNVHRTPGWQCGQDRQHKPDA